MAPSDDALRPSHLAGEPGTAADRVAAMLGARSIAVVGASSRAGSFGERMVTEVLRSPSSPRVHLVHPRLREVRGHACVPSLADVRERVDLVLLGVPDSAVVEQLTVASSRGDAGAVIFGTAPGLGPQLSAAAAGMAVCGAGCMGFVNVVEGVRAIGYLERYPLPVGPIACVTHSGSAFSALLRSHRRLEFSLAVSSGQELVTTAADYLAYALELPETRVVGLLLETMRDVPKLRAGLRRAAEQDIPVVALTVGSSPTGRALVTAHSGALAGDDATWEALFAAHGVHRVRDLDELADTLEAFAIGRRVQPTGTRLGIATVHDSGAERALTADVAAEVGVPFGAIADSTRELLSNLLDSGLVGDNPLDVWGVGKGTRQVFADCLATLAADASVDAVALAVDLVPEYDGDASYPLAARDLLVRTSKPVVVLSHCAAAIDQEQAGALRAAGVPVLEGTRIGLRTLRHLLDQAEPPAPAAARVDEVRRHRWRARMAEAPLDAVVSLELLRDYGLQIAMPCHVQSAAAARQVAEAMGYPVVVKTAEPAFAHKSDVDGVRMGLRDADAVAGAFADVSARLGPRVSVQPQAGPGIELALGVVRDPLLGPLLLLAAGGTLIEVVSQRSVALPPVDRAAAVSMLERLPLVDRLLAGVRGLPAADVQGVVDAVVGLSQLAFELGDLIEALDVNPLVVNAAGAVAVDALVVPATGPD